MSFPPPPGLQQQPSRPQSSQSHPYTSLPPRPPPATSFSSTSTGAPVISNPTSTTSHTRPGTAYNSFTGFQPRAVAASQSFRPHSPSLPAPAAGYQHHAQNHIPNYSQPAYKQPHIAYYGQQQQASAAVAATSAYGQTAASKVQNPFRYSNQVQNNAYAGAGRGYPRQQDSGLDPDTEAQIAQWQSAYMGKESGIDPSQSATNIITGQGQSSGPGRRDGAFSATGANTGPLGAFQRIHESTTSTPPSGPHTTTSTPVPAGPNTPIEPAKTVIRSGGGQSWTDSTLLEWDPAHFRLFVGNLAGEVTDDSLLKAFSKYPSVQKARVIRDKRTEKSKGYGFVSFSDGEDYFRAAREMQGKYIGSHPVLLRRAMTEIRPVVASKVGAGAGGGKGWKRSGSGIGGGGKGGGVGGGKGGGGGGSGGSKVVDGGIQKKQGKTKGGLRVIG
ncbi:uncharacterized protein PADG_03644 [Paracoccidioides brasiliensis Pb18]|uniref:RRM domain-containing protein n=1 Tax=Paracoccidioides brasiliensis (strain Pb18) TaxID=502780 RepID=C1G8Q8_PARBD|nr:uncharacterized protein PADG_03644 [Paracoccidioides brasiliensis Pb18]EEH47560.1 hypothetical protein PADG_03644 [Paracoccidioides brasiliensis Pb18]